MGASHQLKLWLALALIVGSLYIAAAYLSPEFFTSSLTTDQSPSPGFRLVKDYANVHRYFSIAQWWPQHYQPYRDDFIEYPQLATLFFTLPFFFVPQLSVAAHQLIYQLLVLILYLLNFYLAGRLLRANKIPLYYLALFFLPSIIYGLFSGYDILTALLITASLWFFQRQRWTAALLFLLAAFLVKWYPALFFFVYLAYWLNQKKNKRIPLPWRAILITIAVALIIFAATIAWLGWSATFSPYLVHGLRTISVSSPYGLVEKIFFPNNFALDVQGNFLNFSNPSLFFWLTILPFSGLLLLFLRSWRLSKINFSWPEILLWFALFPTIFILTNRYYTPNWYFWIISLIIFIRPNKRMVWLLILYDLFNYFYYPLLFDYNPSCSLALIVNLIRNGLLLILICSLLFDLSKLCLPKFISSCPLIRKKTTSPS